MKREREIREREIDDEKKKEKKKKGRKERNERGRYFQAVWPDFSTKSYTVTRVGQAKLAKRRGRKKRRRKKGIDVVVVGAVRFTSVSTTQGE